MDYLIKGSEYLEKFSNFKLVGRDNEMEVLTSILVRKRSNSLLLVGPSGVGATALCLGLQDMKTDSNAPFDIVAKRLFWLDVDGLFSSGNAEQITKAFNAAISRLKKTNDAILIVEDSGDFYEACRNCGTSHFINLLNSAVKEGKFQVILEVSDKDLTKIITWHSDFSDSYTTMDVSEPVGQALELILDATSEKLSEYHTIKIDDDAKQAAIELTLKYRLDAGLGVSQPMRAINLLDRTLASYRLAAHKSTEIVSADNQQKLRQLYSKQRQAENAIVQYEEEIERLQTTGATQEQSAKGFDALVSTSSLDNHAIREIRRKIEILSEEHQKAASGFKELTAEINSSLLLTRKEILTEFSRITGISANKLGEDELQILRTLETNLKAHVFGQDHVLVQTSNAIKVSRVGRRNKSKPQASFLFMGPSGVGKTEVAKRVAEALQGDPKSLLRFDMSEYMERHAVSKLIGAPPGYEGFEAGGILTNAMRVNRNRIILFDEIEKAHPDVFNLFLQILDDGRLTDNVGRVADFSESIIIMTTNIGQPHFLNMDIDFVTASSLAKVDLDEQYRPEFLNRFNGRQNIICFNRLELDSIVKIVTRELLDLKNAYISSGVEVSISQEDINKFCSEQYDARTGARGLPGVIIAQLEPQVTDFILNGNSGKAEFEYLDAKFVRKEG